MTFAAIVAAVLMLIVLFVLGTIFNIGVGTIFKQFMGIADSADQQAKGTRCVGLFGGTGDRICSKDLCDTSEFKEVSGVYSDCPAKNKAGEAISGSPSNCCERIKTTATN